MGATFLSGSCRNPKSRSASPREGRTAAVPDAAATGLRTTTVFVNDRMQQGYRYPLTESYGGNLHPDFQPQLTPAEMLALGVFGGKYMTDCREEFPDSWFRHAKLCSQRHDPRLNYFGVNASQPLAEWRKKGWIYHEDPRGWFQWYCRYYMGRRCPDDDRQIRRWRAMARHVAQVDKGCHEGDISCRRRQRQALLHWAYDSRRLGRRGSGTAGAARRGRGPESSE